MVRRAPLGVQQPGYDRPLPQSIILGGVLAGVEPTGRRVEVEQIHMFCVRDGQLTEHFAVRDDLGMGRQLGLLPDAPVSARTDAS